MKRRQGIRREVTQHRTSSPQAAGGDRPLIAMVCLLLLTAAGMSYRLTAPWVGQHAFASAQISTIARNHWQYGLGMTHGLSVLRVDRADPSRLTYYNHRPVLLPLALALVFGVLGPVEWAARLFVIGIALATTWFLYRLVRLTSDPWSGFLAAVLFALAPANLYFGRVVSLTQGVVLFLVLVPYAYVRWLESRRWRDYLVLLFVAAMGMNVNWQAYYLAGILPLHWCLFDRRAGEWAKMLGLFALGPVMFGLFLLHLAIGADGGFDELWDVFRYRSGRMDPQEQLVFYGYAATFTVGQLIARLGRHAVSYLTPQLVALALPTVAVLLVQLVRIPRASAARWSMPLVLLVPPLVHTILFSNVMFIHNYLIVLFLPGMAALGGIGLAWLLRSRQMHGLPAWLGAGLAALFLFQAVSTTVELHFHRHEEPVVAGRELASQTQADDDVIVVGLLFHPAVEWYADRNVYFLDHDGPLEEIVPARRRLVAVAKRTPAWLEGISASGDPATSRLAERTRAVLEQVASAGHPLSETESFAIFELEPGTGREVSQ